MPTPTTTMRVRTTTRDRIAALARSRGVSITTFLDQVADQAESQDALASERAATMRDAADHTPAAEEQAWRLAAGDGID